MTKREAIKYLKEKKKEGYKINLKQLKKDLKKYTMSESWIDMYYVELPF